MAPVHREEVVWQERVAGEVEKIRSKNQERKQEDILRAWRGNRYNITYTLLEIISNVDIRNKGFIFVTIIHLRNS